MNTTTKSAPVLQIRVIGPIDFARAVLADRAALVRSILGPDYRYTSQIRTARKAGQVRAYLTITAPKEVNHGKQHDDG